MGFVVHFIKMNVIENVLCCDSFIFLIEIPLSMLIHTDVSFPLIPSLSLPPCLPQDAYALRDVTSNAQQIYRYRYIYDSGSLFILLSSQIKEGTLVCSSACFLWAKLKSENSLSRVMSTVF